MGCAGKFTKSEPEGPWGSTTHQNVAKVNGYMVLFFVSRKNEFEISSIFVRNRYETVVLTDYTPCINKVIQKRS